MKKCSSQDEDQFPATNICFIKTSNNLIGNDQLIMERWKDYFYETLNIKDDVEIREEVIYQGPEEQIEPITEDEVWEVIRTLKTGKPPGLDNVSAEIIMYDFKKLWEVIHALVEVILAL
jgi:hypothetical protein